jgi:hypothetical protein
MPPQRRLRSHTRRDAGPVINPAPAIPHLNTSDMPANLTPNRLQQTESSDSDSDRTHTASPGSPTTQIEDRRRLLGQVASRTLRRHAMLMPRVGLQAVFEYDGSRGMFRPWYWYDAQHQMIVKSTD